MIPRYLVLRERIEAELVDIERAGSKAAEAYKEARQSDRQRTFFLPGHYPLRSQGRPGQLGPLPRGGKQGRRDR